PTGARTPRPTPDDRTPGDPRRSHRPWREFRPVALFRRGSPRDDRAVRNLTIVDGDGHIMEEPNDIWTTERIDHERWGDWVPHKEVIDEIYEIIHVGGRVCGGGREQHDQMAAAVGMTP